MIILTQWLWKLTEVGEWDDEKNDFYVHWLRYKAEKKDVYRPDKAQNMFEYRN